MQHNKPTHTDGDCRACRPGNRKGASYYRTMQLIAQVFEGPRCAHVKTRTVIVPDTENEQGLVVEGDVMTMCVNCGAPVESRS
jgi:hypothetical protein